MRLLCTLSTGVPEVENVIGFLVGDATSADRERASDISQLIECLPQRSDGSWEAARMLATGQMVQLYASCRQDGATFIVHALEASLSCLAHGLKSKVESPETTWALLGDLLNAAARPVAESHEGAATVVRESIASAQALELTNALTDFCDAVLQEGLGDVRAVRAMHGIVAAAFLPHGAFAHVATHLRSVSEFHSRLVALPHLAKALCRTESDEARTELLALLLLLRSLDTIVRADVILPLLVVPWRASLSLADQLTTRLLHLHASPPGARVEASDLSWGSVNVGGGFEWLPASIDPQRLELTLQHFPLARAFVPERCACEASHMSEADETASDASSDEIKRRRSTRTEHGTIDARGPNASIETESASLDDEGSNDDDASDAMDEDDDAEAQIAEDPNVSEQIYDPSVVLAALNAALLAAPEDETGDDDATGLYDMSSIAPRRIVESGLLSLALVALSSADTTMRTVACSVLERFTSLMGRADVVRDSSFRERPQVLALLDALRAGLSNAAQSAAADGAAMPPRISCVVALCLARTAAAALAPAGDMYSALNKWVLRRPALNLDELPLFFATFQVCGACECFAL